MKVLSYVKIFALLIASYFVLCVLPCLIPNEKIKGNIAKSVAVLDQEGCYPCALLNTNQCQMDNFTDALRLDQMLCVDAKHPIKSAMAANMHYFSDDVINAMKVSMQVDTVPQINYARYWHGTTFICRPLLLFMDYSQLRYFLLVVSTVLLVLFACKYSQRTSIGNTLLLMAAFFSCYGFVMQFSLQFFPVLAVAVGGAIILCTNYNRVRSHIGMFFFVIGSLTCFLDLLTAPLLTLGFPLLVWLSLCPDEQIEIRRGVVSIIQHAVLWFSGFALTWVTKWLISSIVLGENIFRDAWGQSVYRLNVEDFTRWDAVCKNFGMLNDTIIIIAILVVLIAIIVSYNKNGWKKALLFALLGVTPYCWYFILSNHSYIHWWFTYRSQIISVACVLLALSGFVAKPKSKSII